MYLKKVITRERIFITGFSLQHMMVFLTQNLHTWLMLGSVWLGMLILRTVDIRVVLIPSCAIAQAVSQWFPTAMAQVKSRGICGRWSGTGAGFPCQFSFHQMLHTHLSSRAGTRGKLMAAYQVDSAHPIPLNLKLVCVRARACETFEVALHNISHTNTMIWGSHNSGYEELCLQDITPCSPLEGFAYYLLNAGFLLGLFFSPGALRHKGVWGVDV
jgi:hypothetical protein